MIHIRGSMPKARALRSTHDVITFETEAARSGAAAIGASLCSIVLVNILRAYQSSDERPGGWLGGSAMRISARRYRSCMPMSRVDGRSVTSPVRRACRAQASPGVSRGSPA